MDARDIELILLGLSVLFNGVIAFGLWMVIRVMTSE